MTNIKVLGEQEMDSFDHCIDMRNEQQFRIMDPPRCPSLWAGGKGAPKT